MTQSPRTRTATEGDREKQSPATSVARQNGQIPEPGTQTQITGYDVDPVARFLDPIERYVALHHDQNALRAEIVSVAGTQRVEQLEFIQREIVEDVFSEYRRKLQAVGTYEEYLGLLRGILLDAQSRFRNDIRVCFDHRLTAEITESLCRGLKFRAAAYLEAAL